MEIRKIRLLHIITGLGVGGAERVVFDLVRLSDKAKFNTSVISLSERDELLSKFRQAQINVTPFYIDSKGKKFLRKFLVLMQYVKKNKIEIVHAHMKHSIFVALLIKIFYPRIKIVFTPHSQNIQSFFFKKLIGITRSLRSIDIIFSPEMRNPIYINSGVIIPNGIDISQYGRDTLKPERFTFIMIGRLEPVKNHIFIINMANKIRITNFRILIVGEGYLRPLLEQKINENKLQDKIILLGLRNDIPELLTKSHCFLMPSLWEGMPITLLEAGAAGVPVVSTPVGSIPSLLQDGAGFIADLDDFQKTIEYVFENYQVALNKAVLFRERIKSKYTIEQFVTRHEAIYSSFLL